METSLESRFYSFVKNVLIKVELPTDLREVGLNLLLDSFVRTSRVFEVEDRKYTITGEQYDSIMSSLCHNKRIVAIRDFREFAQAKLSDAKNIVDKLEKENFPERTNL
jgi:DNA-binding MarR family transcriptional regulator